jgi:hypothetical protein
MVDETIEQRLRDVITPLTREYVGRQVAEGVYEPSYQERPEVTDQVVAQIMGVINPYLKQKPEHTQMA